MVGRVTPTILAMDAFETCFCKRRRISSSFPSSRDFPSTPFGRPSSWPLARADANPSRVRSEIKSLSTLANRPNKATLGVQVLLSLEVDAFLDGVLSFFVQ